MRSFITLLVSTALAGCTTVEPSTPAGYIGPTALVHDSFRAERPEKAQMYVLAAVDGRAIETSIDASRRASSGMGSVLLPISVKRDIPARQLTLRLLGTHQSGALIAEMLYRTAGQFQSVEGIIQFTPTANARYMVTGELAAERSCVWLIDLTTLEPVTEKLCTKKVT